jgi:hypothetical protein
MKNDESKSKRLDILEKLECGKTVASEEIRASFSDFKIDDPEIPDFYLPEIVQIPEISSFAKVKSFRGPFFYYDYNGKDHVIISDSDIKEIHKRLSISLEELRKNIESFRDSEDFLIIQNELKEWSENFRKEIEKMKEDIVRSGKETRSKSAIDPLT